MGKNDASCTERRTNRKPAGLGLDERLERVTRHPNRKVQRWGKQSPLQDAISVYEVGLG